MYDVTALGEILIDFTPAGLSEQGNACFERNPGGAPANVLACISKLGGKTAFIGKVGEDIFGKYLFEVLKTYNIDASGLRSSSTTNTTLAFVQLDEKGDRSFSFYRNPGADTTLEESEVDKGLIADSKVFHFGSLSLTSEPSRSATLAALKHAKKSGCTISYDLNYRPALWKNAGHALAEMKSVLNYADILKISEEEMEFITGEKSLDAGSSLLCSRYGISLVLVTRGRLGCYYRLGSFTGSKPTFEKVRTVDTTGAGDAFLGGFLFSMLSNGIRHPGQLDENNLEKFITFSNAVASICTAKKGAIPAMPGLQQVNELLQGIE